MGQLVLKIVCLLTAFFVNESLSQASKFDFLKKNFLSEMVSSPLGIWGLECIPKKITIAKQHFKEKCKSQNNKTKPSIVHCNACSK